MGQITHTFRILVLSTGDTRFNHLISDAAPRTWCDKIGRGQATSLTGLWRMTGAYLSDEFQDGLCPRCLHYYEWMQRNSVVLTN